MERSPIFEIIKLDDHSATPKYQQLANSIIGAIQSGMLHKDELLPSINELSFEFEVSRDTAERAYKHLKRVGVLGSVPGKGYFVQRTDISSPIRIFLLFNKLSPHKKIIYDSMIATLEEHASVDFYIYNNDFSLFKNLLQNRRYDYTHYVIIPHFLEGGEKAHTVINTIDKDKLILLDKKIPGIEGDYSAVFENFEKDIYGALLEALPRLRKYHTLKIIFPKETYYPEEILKGFLRFCHDYDFSKEVVHQISEEPIQKGEVYLNLMDDDLVTLIERLMNEKFEVGKDVGVISYNETPLKKIILNGITTISTDFESMGKNAADLILEGARKHIEIPFRLTLRSSL